VTFLHISLFSQRSAPHPPLHSFPTRRSSDLPRRGGRSLPRRPKGPRDVLAAPSWRGRRLQRRSIARRDGVSPPPRRDGSRNHRRSEEHTSELQSRFDLVCRLLLEKKKTNTGL